MFEEKNLIFKIEEPHEGGTSLDGLFEKSRQILSGQGGEIAGGLTETPDFVDMLRDMFGSNLTKALGLLPPKDFGLKRLESDYKKYDSYRLEFTKSDDIRIYWIKNGQEVELSEFTHYFDPKIVAELLPLLSPEYRESRVIALGIDEGLDLEAEKDYKKAIGILVKKGLSEEEADEVLNDETNPYIPQFLDFAETIADDSLKIEYPEWMNIMLDWSEKIYPALIEIAEGLELLPKYNEYLHEAISMLAPATLFIIKQLDKDRMVWPDDEDFFIAELEDIQAGKNIEELEKNYEERKAERATALQEEKIKFGNIENAQIVERAITGIEGISEEDFEQEFAKAVDEETEEKRREAEERGEEFQGLTEEDLAEGRRIVRKEMTENKGHKEKTKIVKKIDFSEIKELLGQQYQNKEEERAALNKSLTEMLGILHSLEGGVPELAECTAFIQSYAQNVQIALYEIGNIQDFADIYADEVREFIGPLRETASAASDVTKLAVLYTYEDIAMRLADILDMFVETNFPEL